MGKLRTVRAAVPMAAGLGDRLARPHEKQSVRHTSRGAWDTIRRRILARDHSLCQCDACKAAGRHLIATEVDHRVPTWEGGGDEDGNLQAINAECHKGKTAEEAKRRRGG